MKSELRFKNVIESEIHVYLIKKKKKEKKGFVFLKTSFEFFLYL